MKAEILDGVEDQWIPSGKIAYKDGVCYDVLQTGRTYCVGNLLGRIRAIYDGKTIYEILYPMMSGGFEIIEKSLENIKKYEQILNKLKS